uniref:Uncharacterized protein n=1 Tax=Anguilla anguilla TaxID=7936 RepID=A0A0E9PIN2_ANGAN
MYHQRQKNHSTIFLAHQGKHKRAKLTTVHS